MTTFWYFWFVQLTICLVGTGSAKYAGNLPEQIHLSLGVTEREMLVTWHTIESISDKPMVHYGIQSNNLNQSAMADMIKFKDILYTYRAMMVDLKPYRTYYYKVGSKRSGWSTVYSYRTLQSGDDWKPTFCIYGDLGMYYGKSTARLIEDVDRQMYDVVFHLGDFAYNLETFNGELGNMFMRELEMIAARVPYQTCHGNHERAEQFTHYKARFSMIGDRQDPNPKLALSERLNNDFHSIDIGPMHIIMYSSEYYYYDTSKIQMQYEWLVQDLKVANQNRDKRPWIITMAHRPFYCFRVVPESSCDTLYRDRLKLRHGINDSSGELRYGLENLFYQHGVDIQIFGHDHFYIRMFPIHNRKMYGPSDGNNNVFHDPRAPIHILTGAAGNYEGFPTINKNEWIAFDKRDYCYTKLTVKEQLYILMEQIDLTGEVIDYVAITKSRPMPIWISDSDNKNDTTVLIVMLIITLAIVGFAIAILMTRRNNKRKAKKSKCSIKSTTTTSSAI